MMPCRPDRGRRPRGGLSLVESLLAVAVTAAAGTALLGAIGGAVRSSTESVHWSLAQGLAQQLMDEIAAAPFPQDGDAGPPPAVRHEFADLDHYNGWSSSPPVDRWGRIIGIEGRLADGAAHPRRNELRPDPRFLERFGREVVVQRVRPDGNGNWTVEADHTDYRRVIVRVHHTDGRNNTRTLAELSRIFAHVPPTP